MTPLDILFAVRSLLARPEAWTKGALARGEDDRKVSFTHPHATKFSLDGAFCRIQYFTKARSIGEAYAATRKTIDPKEVTSLTNWNDALGTTHYAVTKILDRTITSLGGVPPSPEENE